MFKNPEKLKIARKLDELGIHQIEAGFPVVSSEEERSVKAIVNEDSDAEILVLARTKQEDIDAAIDCGVDGIITFMGTSDLHIKSKFKMMDREEILNVCIKTVEYAKDHGLCGIFCRRCN